MYKFRTIRSCETLFLLVRDIMRINLLLNLIRSNQIKVKKKRESNKVNLKKKGEILVKYKAILCSKIHNIFNTIIIIIKKIKIKIEMIFQF